MGMILRRKILEHKPGLKKCPRTQGLKGQQETLDTMLKKNPGGVTQGHEVEFLKQDGKMISKSTSS